MKANVLLLILMLLMQAPGAGAQSSSFNTDSAAIVHLQENKIYVFARGSSSKSWLISHRFNYKDTNISHVGIGYIKNKRVYIYHVVDVGHSSASALQVDPIQIFIAGTDVYYFSIWKADNSLREFRRVTRLLRAAEKRRIRFDALFLPGNDDQLYCSEFCHRVLEKGMPRKIRKRPRSMLLKNELYEKILGRKVIRYFPVDFFQLNNHFIKIYERRY